MELSNFSPAAGCTIVFGQQSDDRERFAEAFAAAHPEVCYHVLPALRDYKKPFLGKHKPLWKVLCQNLKKDDRQDTVLLLDLHARVLGSYLLDRAPSAMSRGQKLFWSQVFRAIRGERFFLLRDDNAPFSRDIAAQLLCWLQRNFDNVRVVWVTSATPEQLTQPFWSADDSKRHCYDDLKEYLERTTPLTVADSVWQLQGDTVTQVDLAALDKPRGQTQPAVQAAVPTSAAPQPAVQASAAPPPAAQAPAVPQPSQPVPTPLWDSAESCFKAAEGYLCDDRSHGRPEDALPYLEKLLTLMDEGDPDAGRYVLALNRLNPEMGGRAWQAHQSKK